MIDKDSHSSCEYSSPNHETNDDQFPPTFTASTSNHRKHPGHLIINNFLTSTVRKSMSPQDQQGNSHESRERNTHSNFLYVYFTFSYYLCLTPFRLKKVISPSENDLPVFEIHQYFPQKIICAIANLLAMVRYCVELRKCIQEVKRDNPISFFKLFEGCSSLIFKSVILGCFWAKQQRFLQVVRFLDSPYIVHFNRFKMESIPAISSLCGFYVITGFVRMITGSGFVRSYALTPSWWARRLVAEARYSFFLTNETHVDSAPSLHEISTLDGFLAVITGFTFQCRFIAGYFVDVGILLCVLTLWAPVAGFTANINKIVKVKAFQDVEEDEFLGDSVKSSPPHFGHISDGEVTRQEVVMKQYKALKRLSDLISQASGVTILPFISEAVFGYAIFFEDVLITRDFLHRLILLCFYLCAVSILVFSADVCRKMQCMKMWLWNNERFLTFPNQKLSLVLHDLSTNSVGITASGIFTIDFYLVGSMISVLITLFIIRLQYQSADS